MRKNKKTRKQRRSILQMRESYRYISILSDYGFKQTFGNETDTLFLRKAIQALIQSDVPIESVEFVKNENVGLTADGRGTLFDIICKDVTGRVYIVEMQLNDTTHFFQRAKFYAFHVLNTMVQKGSTYKFDNLKPIFVISFLGDNAFETEHYYQYGQIKNQYGEVMDEQTTYIVVELKKWNKTEEEIKTDLDKIIYIMKTTEVITKKEDFQEPAFFREDWLQSILKELDLARMPPEKRAVYEMEMARRAFEDMIFEKQKQAAVEEVEREKKIIMQEAEAAKKQTEEAKNQAEEAKNQAEEAKKQTEEAKNQAEEAKNQAEEAKNQAEEAKNQAEEAENQAEEAKKQTEEAENQAEEAKNQAEEAENQAEEAKNQAEEAEADKIAALQKAKEMEQEKEALLEQERVKNETTVKKLLLTKVFSIEQIADITSVSIEEINAIQERM